MQRCEEERIFPGDYVRTNTEYSRGVCKAYDAPPPRGQYICTIDPCTYLGPVEEVVETEKFTTILVRGFWVNVQIHRPREWDFALKVPRFVVRGWEDSGWQHRS